MKAVCEHVTGLTDGLNLPVMTSRGRVTPGRGRNANSHSNTVHLCCYRLQREKKRTGEGTGHCSGPSGCRALPRGRRLVRQSGRLFPPSGLNFKGKGRINEVALSEI